MRTSALQPRSFRAHGARYGVQGKTLPCLFPAQRFSATPCSHLFVVAWHYPPVITAGAEEEKEEEDTMRMARVSRLGCSVFFPCFFLLVSPHLSAADQKAAPPAKKTTVAANKPAKPKFITPPRPELTEDTVRESFDVFTIEWMKKLSQTEEFHRAKELKITESPDGFSAEYVGYFPHRYIIVKKTDSKDTPFVGILTYYEKTMRCMGKTKEEARQGPFQPADSQQVSEIFRFTKGKWEY